MKDHIILEHLIGLLEAHNVTIRQEPLYETIGGLCRLKGDQVLFLDAHAEAGELAAVCARTLAEVVDIETIFIRPEIRRFIEYHITVKLPHKNK